MATSSKPESPAQFAPYYAMEDRFKIMAKRLTERLPEAPELNEADIPKLTTLLNAYVDPNVPMTKEKFMQSLLIMFRDSVMDKTYHNLLERCTEDEKNRLEAFVDAKDTSSLDEISKDFHPGNSLMSRSHIKPLLQSAPQFFEKSLASNQIHKEPDVEKRDSLEFTNWGKTVRYTPKYTYVPKTVQDVQQIVRFAKKKNMTVRCSGYRHSWSPIFGRSGEILISTLQIGIASRLPNLEAQTWKKEKPPTDLETIELLNEPPREGGKRLVRIGCATTNERLRRWCVKNNALTMPFNIIMVEITAGGSNAPICHGAGIKHQTLSDLVRRIEYVDAHGELRTITEKDSDFLKAASGCFGLMGIVTHLTLELDPMSYAVLSPEKIPVAMAVPPPADMWDRIPEALLPKEPWTEEQKQQAQRAFEDKANNDYYSEWFWFPYADNCWVNCWNTTTDASGVQDWPSSLTIFKQFLEEFTLNVFQKSQVLNFLGRVTGVAEFSTTLLSRFATWSLPGEEEGDAPFKPIKTYLCDALHFQRAIQNVRVRDLEVEIPLTPKKDDPTKPDYTNVQRAWWDAILKAYQHSKASPQRMPLEMRIMGGSNVIMAPQRGNHLGTCSIEILTLQNAVEVWQPYAQEILDLWMSYTDADGNRLKTRPHWAKEWYEGYTVNGQPWINKLRNEDYAAEIVQFKEILTAIGQEHGWTLEDLRQRFSNDLFDELIFNNNNNNE